MAAYYGQEIPGRYMPYPAVRNPRGRAKVRRHEKIEVRYENSLVKDSGGQRRVTAVMIDGITASEDAGKHSLTVTGRSPARDIIDSSWGGLLYNMTLFEITKETGGTFGINCINIPANRGDPAQTVNYFSWENESPWTKLITGADRQGFMLTGNEAGVCIYGRRKARYGRKTFTLPKRGT